MKTAMLSVRRCLLLGLVGLAVMSVLVVGQRGLMAAATPEQTQKLKKIDSVLKTAETQFRAKKYDESGASVKEAQSILAELEKVPEFTNQVAGLKKRIERVQSQVEMAASKGNPPAGGNVAGGRVSFVRNVAPILVTKCGRCHVNDKKGDFNMATYELLKQGTKDGLVVMPGKGSGSRLVEVIESGDMPRGGAKVSKPELEAITKWIDEGARFDGRDSNTPLVRLVSSAAANAAMEPSELKVVAATGKETVSYSKDIAPVLLASCVECHTAQRLQGRLCMDNFELFMKGGASGNPWIPADPAESILIKKLKGTLGQRMPLQRDPLPDETIAKFEKWIAEGAKFDGGNSTQATPILVRAFKIKTLTHEQLAKERVESSQQKWRLASPMAVPAVLETKNFLIMGRTSEAILAEVGKAAEEQAVAVGRVFRAPADKPLVKGRITLFAFPSRYDYSEFGQMVEERKLPPEWRGHFGVDVSDVFGVFVLPDSAGGSDYTIPGIVGQQVAAAYIGSLSNVPSWFADGCGHVYAAKVDQKAGRVKQWNDRLAQVASAGRLDQLLGRGLTPEETEAAAYGFVKSLMNNSGKFNALLMALRKGDEFDQAFTRAFGEPKAVLAAWVKSQ
jgi:mono/diheme cytochrome c family protein